MKRRRWSRQISVDAETRLTFLHDKGGTFILKVVNIIMCMLFDLHLFQLMDMEKNSLMIYKKYTY